MIFVQHYEDISPYQTKDGSIIREIQHPCKHSVENQSLAEATVRPGESTNLHYHRQAEEIYYILRGHGLVSLADESVEVMAGMAITIAPGTPHNVVNNGMVDLVFLCCSSPAYSHHDTVMV